MKFRHHQDTWKAMPKTIRRARHSRPGSRPASEPIDIWLMVFPGFVLLDATGPVQVFATANDEATDAGLAAPYRVRLISRSGGEVISSAGISVITDKLPRINRLHGGTLIVSGVHGMEQLLEDKPLLQWLTRAYTESQRCCSVCNGALLLAQAGLLRNKQAVTHWKDVEQLRNSHPDVHVQDDAIYVRDGKIYTSAGSSAGIDLALSLVEENLGRSRALSVAKRLVVYYKRPGGQRQFSSELLAQCSNSDLVEQLTQWLKPRLHRHIDIEQMAAAMAMSGRTLHRRLRLAANLSPAKLLEQLRMETACRLLEEGRHSIKTVADKSGFGTEYNLRRAFSLNLGVLPSEYRERFA